MGGILGKRPPSPNRFTDSPIGIKLTIITNQCKIHGHLTMNKRTHALQWLVTVAVLLLLRGMGYRETRPEGSMAQFFQAINIRFIESPPRPMIFHVSEVVNNRQIHSYILHCFIYSTSNLLPLHRTHKYPKWLLGCLAYCYTGAIELLAGDFSYNTRIFTIIHRWVLLFLLPTHEPSFTYHPLPLST